MRADLIMAWLQQQPTRERPDTFRRTAVVSTTKTLARAGQVIHFSQGFLQRCHVKHRLCQPMALVVRTIGSARAHVKIELATSTATPRASPSPQRSKLKPLAGDPGRQGKIDLNLPRSSNWRAVIGLALSHTTRTC